MPVQSYPIVGGNCCPAISLITRSASPELYPGADAPVHVHEQLRHSGPKRGGELRHLGPAASGRDNLFEAIGKFEQPDAAAVLHLHLEAATDSQAANGRRHQWEDNRLLYSGKLPAQP